MTIKEVCEKYGLSQDTLRYYEKTGVIPKVARSCGGIRCYSEEDIRWIEYAVCMRSAGMPVERLAEYVRLTRLGDSTFAERRALLMETRAEVSEKLACYETALKRLDCKIARYDEALKTGHLDWEDKECCDG